MTAGQNRGVRIGAAALGKAVCYEEVKGTLHELNNETFREFQGRMGVGMTGIAGEERLTGHFPCLQIYTLHNEQCMATEDF